MKRTLGDQVRKAIEDSGYSRYRIAQETGISQAVLSRFVNGKASLTLDTTEKLSKLIKLEIRVVKGNK
jgi:transcriptional regulator with XRE-family HTH domain